MYQSVERFGSRSDLTFFYGPELGTVINRQRKVAAIYSYTEGRLSHCSMTELMSCWS